MSHRATITARRAWFLCRHRLLHVVLATVCATAIGCGEETSPDIASLTARDILGLEVEHVAAMSVDDRALLVTTLEQTWPGDPHTRGVAHLVDLDEARPAASNTARLKAHIGALDAQRTAADLPPLPMVALDVDRQLAVELLDTPSAVLELAESGLWQVREDLDDDNLEPFDGYIVWDEQWPSVERDALGGLSEREAIERLEPALRALLAHSGDDGSVRVVPASRAPLLVWYAPVSRTVLVNPTLLYLLDADGLTSSAPPRQPSQARAAADPAPEAGADSGFEPDVPDGVDPPPRIDGMQDGGSSGLTDCDCGDGIEDSCNDAAEEFFIVTGIVLLGAALFAGVLLLIVFLV